MTSSTGPDRGAPAPKDLLGAMAVARTLAYVVGFAGIVAGAVYNQSGGSTIIMVAMIVFTIAIAGLLMVSAFLLQAMTAIMARMTAMESDMRVLLGRGSPGDRLGIQDRNDTPW